MEKGGRTTPEPEEPEEINGFLVLGREVRSDGMTVVRLEDGLVSPDDPERHKKIIERAQDQIKVELGGRRSEGRSLGLPMTAMRRPSRPKPSTGKSS